jgi:hypothetical protein
MDDFMQPRYEMPTFEDGSVYAPKGKVTQVITNRFTPIQWNRMPDDRKWLFIDQIEKTLPPVASGQAKVASGKRTQGIMEEMAEGAAKQRLPFHPPDIKGIFGGQ